MRRHTDSRGPANFFFQSYGREGRMRTIAGKRGVQGFKGVISCSEIPIASGTLRGCKTDDPEEPMRC
jgi:hypothetical protein